MPCLMTSMKFCRVFMKTLQAGIIPPPHSFFCGCYQDVAQLNQHSLIRFISNLANGERIVFEN